MTLTEQLRAIARIREARRHGFGEEPGVVPVAIELLEMPTLACTADALWI